jgi:hypothetical protein
MVDRRRLLDGFDADTVICDKGEAMPASPASSLSSFVLILILSREEDADVDVDVDVDARGVVGGNVKVACFLLGDNGSNDIVTGISFTEPPVLLFTDADIDFDEDDVVDEKERFE